MKAAVYYETGAPEVLKYEDVPDPVCFSSGIVIKVEAIAIEGGDVLNRFRGEMPSKPHIVGYQAAGEVIEQVISREDPSFRCATARMQVGLDGNVYLASNVGESSCGLRVDLEGNQKLSGSLLPSPEAIAANPQGLIGVANCHFQKSIVIYDHEFTQLAEQSDFRIGDGGSLVLLQLLTEENVPRGTVRRSAGPRQERRER